MTTTTPALGRSRVSSGCTMNALSTGPFDMLMLTHSLFNIDLASCSLAASSSGGRLGSLTPLGVWPTHDFPSGGTCCAAGTRLSATTANAAAALMVTRKRRFIIRSPDPAIQKLSSALFAFSRGRNLRRPDVEPELPELFVLFVVGPAALEDVRQPVVSLVAAIFQHRLRRVHRQRHRESPRPNPRLRILYRD